MNTDIATFAAKVLGKPFYPYQLEVAEAIVDSIRGGHGRIFTVMMALLRLTGRDITTFALSLLRDEQTSLWRCTGEVADHDDQSPTRAHQPSTSRQEILDLLREKGAMTPAEIARGLGKDRGATKSLVQKMHTDGMLVRDAKGRYRMSATEERESA